MSDTTITPENAAEEFDVFGWLEGTQQPSETIEIYNDGPVMLKLNQLAQGLVNINEKRAEQESQLLREVGSIADEEVESDQAIIDEIEKLRESLRGTGVVFEVQAISAGERKVLAETIARKLKAKPAKGKQGDEDYEDAIPGGEEHPDYQLRFTNELVAKCIVSVTSKTGAKSTTKWTPEKVNKLRDTLPGVEYTRLSNVVFRCNYMAYEIENMIDVDFSSRP